MNCRSLVTRPPLATLALILGLLAGLGQWQGGTIQTTAIADDRGVLTQAFILLPPPDGSL